MFTNNDLTLIYTALKVLKFAQMDISLDNELNIEYLMKKIENSLNGKNDGDLIPPSEITIDPDEMRYNPKDYDPFISPNPFAPPSSYQDNAPF